MKLKSVSVFGALCLFSVAGLAQSGLVWNAAAQRWTDVVYGPGHTVQILPDIPRAGSVFLNGSPRDLALIPGSVAASNSGGSLVAKYRANLALGDKPVTLLATMKPRMPSVARAVVKAGKSLIQPLSVGFAIYDIFKALNTDPFIENGELKGTQVIDSSTYDCDPWAPGLPRPNSPAAVCIQGAQSSLQTHGPLGSDPIALASDGWCKDYGGNGSRYIFPTCQKTPSSTIRLLPESEMISLLANNSNQTDAISRALNEALKQGEVVDYDPLSVTGPASIPGSTTTTQNADGTTTTTTNTNHITYQGDNVTNVTTSTTSIYNPVTNTTTNTTTNTENAPVPKDIETCGLPGKPICNVKVDESGMPNPVPETQYSSKLESVKPAKDAALQRMGGGSDSTGFFSGWGVFWGAPAVVQCVPIPLPERGGVSMGSLNPCPVVDGVRSVMAYIWAAAGLFLCLGMVRQTVQGG